MGGDGNTRERVYKMQKRKKKKTVVIPEDVE